MKIRSVVIALAALNLPWSSALAVNFSSHANLCVNETLNGKTVSIVAKDKLAKAIVNSNKPWQDLFVNADDHASDAKFAPQWRRILTDPEFCEKDDPGCLGPPVSKSDKPDIKSKPD